MSNSYWRDDYRPLFPTGRSPGPHYDVMPGSSTGPFGSIPLVEPPPRAFLEPAEKSGSKAAVAVGLGLGLIGLLGAIAAKKKVAEE